jgi:hypothetical protein
VFSYPWAVTIREMVELWPKEKGGVCTWDNNYRKAAVWVRISILKYKSYLLKKISSGTMSLAQTISLDLSTTTSGELLQ